jgi:hypothetical protein
MLKISTRPLAAALLRGLTAVVVVPASDVQAAEGSFPKPAVANSQWTLDLEVGNPRPIALESSSGTQWFWYLPYKVINRTGEDRLFLPEVTVVTDAGNVIDANVGIPANLFGQIKSTLRSTLLESPDTIVGNLKQGEDFARESAVIWPAFRSDVDRFSLFFTGISGETAPLLSPSTGEPLTEPEIDPYTGQVVKNPDGSIKMRPVLARRTVQLDYATPGSTDNPQNTPVQLLERKDVMR